MICDVAFFAYSVSDVPRARAFYQDTLGLVPGSMVGDHWVEFNVGKTTFSIGNGEPLGRKPGTSFGAAFEVDDIVAEHDRLASQGVTVSEIHDTPVCRMAFVSDPEGNRFALHQRK